MKKSKIFMSYDRKQLINNRIKIFLNFNKDYSKSFLEKKT